MPYININEYDYTIQGTTNLNDNMVAIPINANDGPSDKWVAINSYDQFIQIFGPNPNPSSQFGNSWEYAANLLLRGMSVLVRRITNVLSDDGENTDTLLPDVKVAKAAVKVADVVGESIINRDYSNEDLVVTDSSKHSVLESSFKGNLVDNELYKTYPENITDGITGEGPFPNVYTLQHSEQEYGEVGAFADVITTNTEWNYRGAYPNDHYKFIAEGQATPMSYIKQMNQLEDEDGNKYLVGDFFINEDNHIVRFVTSPIKNENWIKPQKTYPDELKDIDISNLNEESFVDVIKDSTNKNNVKYVWKYTSNSTTIVSNHKFVDGTKSIEGKDYKLFENSNALPTDKIGVGYFAGVDNTSTIWVYDGTNWSNTGTELAELETNNNKYSLTLEIPFECTNVGINTLQYQHYFYWENTGEEVFIDTKNPELAYLPTLYWVNSGNPINTRPHKIVTDYKLNINDITINTSSTTQNSNITLEVNGYRDILIDPDFADSRLTAGTFAFTNTTQNPINIYDLTIIQKGFGTESSYVVYNIGLDKIVSTDDRITADPLLKFVDSKGNIMQDPIPKIDNTIDNENWFIELPAGATILYNRDLTNASFNFKVAGFDSLDLIVNTFKSVNGRYDISLSADTNKTATVKKYYIDTNKKIEDDFNNLPVIDGNGNFNLFVAEYLYPGTNGNFLNVRIKTIENQGIYAYVYRNNQQLERIELVSFRVRNSSTGRVKVLDLQLNKQDIWRILLSKFGILLLEDGKPYNQNLQIINSKSYIKPIISNYISLSLNSNILDNGYITSLDFIDSLYAQIGSKSQQSSLNGGSNPDDEHVIHEVSKCYEPLKDKYRYSVKFISNGAYIDKLVYSSAITSPLAKDTDVRLIEDAMIDVATARADCVAYLDVPYDLELEEVPYYFEHLSTSYAAAYDPWAYIILETGSTKWMPPSFLQLYTHARSIQNGNKMYLPPAGVRRAQVPEIIKTNHDISSKYITLWQNSDSAQFINPIIWINGFDYTIYGQKTLYNIINASDKYESALQDLNVRLVANEIKRLVFRTCIELTFELNNIMTWNEFKSKIEPTLNVMQGEGVLSDYSVVMGTETMTAADLNSGHIVGTVRVAIGRAATDWDINFEITPNSVTFNEYDYNSTYSN